MTRATTSRFILFVLATAAASPSPAQNATEELLTLPKARRLLTVEPLADGGVAVCRDGLRTNLALDPGVRCSMLPPKSLFSFIASTRNQVQVLLPEFNPLRMSAVITTTKSADSSNLSVAPFSDESLKAISVPAAAAAAAAKAAVASGPTESVPARNVGGGNLKAVITKGRTIEQLLKKWAALTDGLASIKEIREALGCEIEDIGNAIKASDDLRDETIRALKGAGQTPTGGGDPASTSINAALSLALAADPIQNERELLTALKELDAALKPYEDSKRWVGNALVVESIRTSTEDVLEKKVAITEFEWTAVGGALTRKAKELPPVTLRARAARWLVPEASAAIAHTRLTKPVYSAVTEDGKTRVKRGKDEGVDVKAAALLNFVCRCFTDTELFPMLQIGTTEIDAAPAVLFGGGLRLFGKTPLAISAGGVAAWIRDLNNLKPDQEIKSDLEIAADLKRRLQIKAYFAVQYRF